MVLPNSLMIFLSADRNLSGFQIELKHSNSMYDLLFFCQSSFLSEAICGRKQNKLVCNSYLLGT